MMEGVLQAEACPCSPRSYSFLYWCWKSWYGGGKTRVLLSVEARIYAGL